MHADHSIFQGTGKEVARFLAKDYFQELAILHCLYLEVATAMKKYLSNARLAPFGSFDINAEKNLL